MRGGRAGRTTEEGVGRPLQGRGIRFGLCCVKCGQDAETNCPECGPECLDCFTAGGVWEEA